MPKTFAHGLFRQCGLHAAVMLWGLLAASPTHAQMRVAVTPDFRAEYGLVYATTMNSIVLLNIGSLRPGDHINFNVQSTKAQKYVIEILPSSEIAERYAFLTKPKFPGTPENIAPYAAFPVRFDLTGAGDYGAILIARSWWFGADTATITYSIERSLRADERQAIGARFAGLADLVNGMFVVPPFTATVNRCDQHNAWSEYATGNITYCSELLSDVDDNAGVRDGIFFHELGHTVLSLWGLPGGTEENMADQFAVYMLLSLRGGPGAASDLARYFETSSNPWSDVYAIINYGDTHAIGIQRARNISMILRDPEPFMAQWNGIVYPHMQPAQLQRIAAAPRPYESQALARELLSQYARPR